MVGVVDQQRLLMAHMFVVFLLHQLMGNVAEVAKNRDMHRPDMGVVRVRPNVVVVVEGEKWRIVEEQAAVVADMDSVEKQASCQMGVIPQSEKNPVHFLAISGSGFVVRIVGVVAVIVVVVGVANAEPMMKLDGPFVAVVAFGEMDPVPSTADKEKHCWMKICQSFPLSAVALHCPHLKMSQPALDPNQLTERARWTLLRLLVFSVAQTRVVSYRYINYYFQVVN